jgi:hypothetical protein
MSIFRRLRKGCEDDRNCWKARLGRFLLVRHLKSVARYSGRPPGGGDFLSKIEEAMSITPIVLVLIILLFGFDSTELPWPAR